MSGPEILHAPFGQGVCLEFPFSSPRPTLMREENEAVRAIGVLLQPLTRRQRAAVLLVACDLEASKL